MPLQRQHLPVVETYYDAVTQHLIEYTRLTSKLIGVWREAGSLVPLQWLYGDSEERRLKAQLAEVLRRLGLYARYLDYVLQLPQASELIPMEQWQGSFLDPGDPEDKEGKQGKVVLAASGE